MQTDDDKRAAEDILSRLGRADKSPKLWQPAGSYRGDPLSPPPQSWVERAVSAALLLVGDDKLVHVQALRVDADHVRLTFLTDSLLILSDSIDTTTPPLATPLDVVPRAALRTLKVTAEEGVIVKGSVVATPQGYPSRDVRTWPGIISVTAVYDGIGAISFSGPGDGRRTDGIRGLLDSLRDDLIAAKKTGRVIDV